MVKKAEISIIFLTFDGITDYFKETLKSVLSQSTKRSYEIITIDSGSTDGTVEFVKRYGNVRLYEIPNSEFSHSRTRQMGAELANGDYLVFLTQDATPAGNQWLDNLVRNFNDPEVVGVCGRIIPRKDAFVLRKINVENDLSGRIKRIEAQIEDKEKFEKLSYLEKRLHYYFFYNISSAVRKNFILENPFPDVPFAEDLEFARVALAKGKKIVYEPDSVVYHSHNYSLKKTYQRNLIDARYHKVYLNIRNVPTLFQLWKNVREYVSRDWISLASYDLSKFDKTIAMLYSPIIHFAEQLGQYRGGK
ncbi:MAG: glycosyltransferase [Parcubacteria group bacterium]|jgi:rhamnosyltransferase